MTLSATDFHYVCGVVRDGSAVALVDGKQYLVESRLAPLAAGRGLRSVSVLVEELRSGKPGLRQEVIEAMVTNETLFFRDVHPFEALRHQIIPAALQNNGGRLSLWSAAASTGQEAYSLALVLREHFPSVGPGTVLATDLSGKALERAVAGRFTQLEVNRGLPASLLVKHFDRHGRDWQIQTDIKEMVVFRQLNLTKSFAGVPPMDVILLRNVLVYFEPRTKAAVLAGVAKVLRPGGYLFLGGTENLGIRDHRFEQVQLGRSLCYRRADPQERNK